MYDSDLKVGKALMNFATQWVMRLKYWIVENYKPQNHLLMRFQIA